MNLLYASSVLSLVAALSLATNACSPATNTSSPAPDASAVSLTPLPVTILVSAVTSGFDEPTQIVVRDGTALADTWRTLHAGVPGNPAPTVDFNSHSVILVALGQRRTGGYSVSIDHVNRSGDGAVVTYTATSPGQGCMTTQMITSPVLIISVPRVASAVTFTRRDVMSSC